MPIDRYPRLGRRIAPSSLAEFLEEPLPAGVLSVDRGFLLLKDLDESVWTNLGVSDGRNLACAVVAAVARRIRDVGRLQISALPEHLEWGDVDLGVRAYNALTSGRKLARPASLNGWPLAELMKTNAFGVRSLVDLLVALEDATGLRCIVEGGGFGTAQEGTPGTGSEHSGNDEASGVLSFDLQQGPPLSAFMRDIKERLEWDDLNIGIRTFNALAVRRRLTRPSALNGMLVGDLMSSKNFGRKSLRDLLTALHETAGRSCIGLRRASTQLIGKDGARREQLSLQYDSGLKKLDDPRMLDLAVELMKLEQALGPDIVQAKDPRFGRLVRALGTGACNTSELIATFAARLGRAGCEHLDRLKALRNLCAGIEEARTLTLLAELDAIAGSICTDAQKSIVLRFWGWDGLGGATLQKVGNEHGITRERVRQITSRAKKRLEARGEIFAPAAIHALEIVQGVLPATVSQTADALVREEILPNGTDIRFLCDLGPALDRPKALWYDQEHCCLVSTRDGAKFVWKAHRQASRIADKYGVACAADVCDAIGGQSIGPLHVEHVAGLIRTRGDLLWLDDVNFWFCRRDIRGNALLRRVHKVVAVAGRVRVVELRGGIARDYHLKGTVPPKAILLSLCGLDPALEVQGDIVAKRDGADVESALSPTEKTLRRVLLENGSVMERSLLEREFLTTSLGRPSLQSALTYSPIVIRYAPQVYGLRGLAIPLGTVDSIQPLRWRRNGRLLVDSGWVGDGRVRLVYRLSKGCVSNGIVTIPASFTKFLRGDFRLLRQGNDVGLLRCRGAQGWGLGTLFRRVAAEAGDTLTLEFHLKASEAHASISVEVPEAPIMRETQPEVGVDR